MKKKRKLFLQLDTYNYIIFLALTKLIAKFKNLNFYSFLTGNFSFNR